MGDGDFPREECEYALKVRVLSSSQGPLGLKLGIGLGQGQCDLPPLTMLAGTWNSNVCPGLAVSGTVSATWSWLGCALEEEFGQGLCRARVESGHLLPERRDPHELLPRYPCLRDVCLHRRHLLSRWRWHLAQRGRRRFRLWCRVSARMGLRRMPSLRGGQKADVARGPRLLYCLLTYFIALQVYMGWKPRDKTRTHTPLSDGRRTTVHAPWAHREAAWSALYYPLGRRGAADPRGRRRTGHTPRTYS